MLLLDEGVELVGIGAGVAVSDTLEAVVTSMLLEADGCEGAPDVVVQTCAEADDAVGTGLVMVVVVVVTEGATRVVGWELTIFVDDEVQLICVDVGCGRVLELELIPAGKSN